MRASRNLVPPVNKEQYFAMMCTGFKHLPQRVKRLSKRINGKQRLIEKIEMVAVPCGAFFASSPRIKNTVCPSCKTEYGYLAHGNIDTLQVPTVEETLLRQLEARAKRK